MPDSLAAARHGKSILLFALDVAHADPAWGMSDAHAAAFLESQDAQAA